MARSIWNGMISFGMVSIPVKLYSATQNKDISFHQVHDVCQTRIKYQKWCPHCERVVEPDEIDRGYEFARGQYVLLEEEDFEKLPLPSKHTIAVTGFVKTEEIDPVYHESTYYLEPNEAALRPYVLFMRALMDKQMIGIASITLRNKERLCSLRPLGGTLLLDTLLYPDEVRVSADTELPPLKVNEKELGMAEHLIELMTEEFDPARYHDHYREALQGVIEAKLAGKEIAEVREAPRAKVIDLMDALRASVENAKGGRKATGNTNKKSRASDETDGAETIDASEETSTRRKRSRSNTSEPEERPKRSSGTTKSSSGQKRKRRSAG